MKNLLQEFENIELRKSKIVLSINLLYISICLIVIPFIIFQIYYEFTDDDSTINGGTYVLLVGVVILLTTLYFTIKIKKAGWLLLTLISGLLWGFLAKFVFFYITSEWEITSALNTSLVVFLFLATSALLFILYLTKTRKLFKIDITFIAISIIVNLLVNFIVLLAFS